MQKKMLSSPNWR